MQSPSIPEYLPGEPQRRPPSTLLFCIRIFIVSVMLKFFILFTAWLWPIYLIGVLLWGLPPNVPRLRQIVRFFRMIWSPTIPAPGLPFLNRVWLTICVTRKCAFSPIWGLAWILDEILYGKELNNIQIVEPLIEISAARSGSTQMARYLEDDPSLVAPSLLQCVFPYLWMWRLAPHTIGRLISKEDISHKMEAFMPPAFIQRHEGNPFKTDTFEGALFMAHLNSLSVFLGPRAMVQEFGFHAIGAHNQKFWERDFIDLFDGIGRKTLLDSGLGPNGKPRRLFVKGHFLCAANALEETYPDARFLTIIREPAPRFKSALNFIRANPISETLGDAPWPWLISALLDMESGYCEVEQEWFTRQDGALRHVIRFNEYVKDLEGTMEGIYQVCLDTPELPPHVPLQHPPRKRTDYLIDRSLEDVGIDVEQLNDRLSSYIEWCR